MDFLKSLFSGFLTDPKSKMRDPLICAHCNNNEELKVKEKFGVKVYLCHCCHGTFLSQGSLNNILNFQGEEEWPELFEFEANTEHTYERSPETRRCPGCGDRMDNQQFWYTSGIWIDFCPNGHGVWLDRGEINLINTYHKSIDLSKPVNREELISMAESYKSDYKYEYKELKRRAEYDEPEAKSKLMEIERDIRDREKIENMRLEKFKENEK